MIMLCCSENIAFTTHHKQKSFFGLQPKADAGGREIGTLLRDAEANVRGVWL